MRRPFARRLDSWKEIAEYLGREVRTVIRWEKERGLPVHRIPGGKRAGVFAHAEEIDRWLNHAPPPDSGEANGSVPSPMPGGLDARSGEIPAASSTRRAARIHVWLLPAGIAVGILATLLWSHRFGRPTIQPIAGVSLENGALVARGPDGSVLWSHSFGRAVLQLPDSNASVIHEAADLDGDGIPEHLVNVPWFDASAVVPHELFGFSATGESLWSVRLSDEVTFGGGRYGPPWISPVLTSGTRPVVAYEIQGTRRIAWAQNHHTWWPAILSVLDSRGRTISKWVHAGNIRALASLGGDPPFLLVVGTSNSRAAAFLAVLDARNVSGSGPEEPGSPYECLSCSAGRPLRYFVFPPSELTLAHLLPYNHGVGVKVLPDGFEVQTQEGEDSFRLVGLYRFSPELRLRHAAWSDGWLPVHRRFEREGRIDHSAESCPEAKRPPRVLEWEPGKGFHDLSATPVAMASRYSRPGSS